MKPKEKPGSKIPTTSINTNKKKPGGASGNHKFDKAFLKKNEFALILLGALLLTMIIFFIFFQSSKKETKPIANQSPSSSFIALEKRIEVLETALNAASQETKNDSVKEDNHVGLEVLENRIIRLETAVLIKFESLTERMDSFEKNNRIKAKQPVPATPEAAEPKSNQVSSPPVKKKARTAVKKQSTATVKKSKTTSIFHTVQKKETLYSISKKYKTTVANLKKLNQLTDKDKIYPGDNIIVK